jgi:small conductance mechanosensitive channel
MNPGDASMNFESAIADAVEKLRTWLHDAVLMLPNLTAAVLIVLAAWLVARMAVNVTQRVLARVTPYQEINRLAARIVQIGILSGGVFIAMGVLELDKTVTSLLTGAGILTLIVGLAFQDLASNFIAGVLLQLRQPFRRGQLIRTNDFYGSVEHINLRSTVIRSLDGQIIRVPNKDVFQNPLVNFSQTGHRRVVLDVGVTYGEDLEKVREVAIGAVRDIPARKKDRDVECFYTGFGESSIDFSLRFWIDFKSETDYLDARGQAVMRIKAAFDDNDVTIPFPIRTLDFGRVGGSQLKEVLPAQWYERNAS